MKNYIWLIAAALMLVAMVVWSFRRTTNSEKWAPETPDDTEFTITSTPPPPVDLIQISIANSKTKEEWMDQAVSIFNDRSRSDGRLQVNGMAIHVEVLCEEMNAGQCVHYRSVTMVPDTLQEKIQPTVISPGEES